MEGDVQVADIEKRGSYTPRRVLELACGSGRIGIELLHSPGAFQLEGLDIAPEMLNAYRRKLEREPEAVRQRVTLHEGDMCNYLISFPSLTF